MIHKKPVNNTNRYFPQKIYMWRNDDNELRQVSDESQIVPNPMTETVVGVYELVRVAKFKVQLVWEEE